MQKFIGGIGCFWDETKYKGVPGIISTECGYCGGKNSTVSYEQVCAGDTEHIEVVNVQFDPKKISYEEVTRLFFKFHDPTTSNRQGPNIGYQYRSEIFYNTNEEKKIAEKVLNEVNKKLFLDQTEHLQLLCVLYFLHKLVHNSLLNFYLHNIRIQ